MRLVAKIADLGVSRNLEFTAELATTFYGTPLYISPGCAETRLTTLRRTCGVWV